MKNRTDIVAVGKMPVSETQVSGEPGEWLGYDGNDGRKYRRGTIRFVASGATAQKSDSSEQVTALSQAISNRRRSALHAGCRKATSDPVRNARGRR